MIIGICCWPFNFSSQSGGEEEEKNTFIASFAFVVSTNKRNAPSGVKFNINSSHCYSNGNFNILNAVSRLQTMKILVHTNASFSPSSPSNLITLY